MFRKLIVAATLLALPLAGCALKGSIGGTDELDALTGKIGQIEDLIPELLLQKYVVLHNLRVRMNEIDAAAGLVTMAPTTMTPMPPMIIPVPPPAPAPAPPRQPLYRSRSQSRRPSLCRLRPPTPTPIPAPTPQPVPVPTPVPAPQPVPTPPGTNPPPADLP